MANNSNLFTQANLIKIEKKSEDITNSFTKHNNIENKKVKNPNINVKEKKQSSYENNKKEIILTSKNAKEKKVLFNVTLKPSTIQKIKILAKNYNLSASELFEQIFSQIS